MRRILIIAVVFLVCSCNRHLLSDTELNTKTEHDSIIKGLASPLEVYSLNLHAPDSFSRQSFQLKRLNQLEIYNPKFNLLPSSIGQFKNLQILIVVDGNINTIPAEIGRLKNLKWLRLWNLNLTTLPAELEALQRLEKLELFANDLRVLPKSVTKLSNLKEIGLDANYKLDYFDAVTKLSKLPDLRLLNLNYYPHDTLPSNIGDLKNLETITLWRNKSSKLNLDQFIKNISSLKKLKSLDLSGVPVDMNLKSEYINRIRKQHDGCNVIWNDI